MTGIVNDKLEARLLVTMAGGKSARRLIEALSDTGFTDHLTLPVDTIELLQLVWRSQIEIVLADGSTTFADVYAARIEWHGRPRRIRLIRADGVPLLEMKLLADSDLNMRVQPGGVVQVTEIA